MSDYDKEAYLSLADEFDPMGATTDAVLTDFDEVFIEGAKRYARANNLPLPWEVCSIDIALELVQQVEVKGLE